MQRLTRKLLAAVVVAFVVTACGGGGGGSGDDDNVNPPPPPPSPPPSGQTFTLSGTITAASSQTVDSDTNDPGRVAIDNDTPGTLPGQR